MPLEVMRDRIANAYDGVTYVLASNDIIFVGDTSALYDRPCPVSIFKAYMEANLSLSGARITSGTVAIARLAPQWDYYANNWSVEPSFNAAITGGDVYDYTLSGTTRYRFVPSPYDPAEDKFYLTFDGVTLSNLLVSRG